MNRYYIAFPVILMVVFSFFYSGASKEAALKEEAKKVAEAQKLKQDEIRKKELEEKARLDSEKRTLERVAQDKEREDKRITTYQNAINRIKETINRFKNDVSENTKLVAKLEKDIADMRARREKEGRETFELVKRVELAKIQRRNAELEIQRYTDMVARRANQVLSPKVPSVATAAQ